MKLLDGITGFFGLPTVKVAVIAFALGVVIGFGTGWFEKGLRVEAAKVKGLEKGIEAHGKQEESSQQAGKDAEHAKRKAKDGMASVPKSNTGTGMFSADGVREQSDLITSGESAFHRID